MRSVCLVLLSFLSCILIYGQDYREYHTQIIKAEEEIFVNNNLDRGLTIYLKTFREFDFVFASDCATAMQIALHRTNPVAFLYLADKGTQNGLLVNHLDKIPYISQHQMYLHYRDTIQKMVQRNRPQYLAGIDTGALKTMYMLYARDQAEKNGKKGTPFKERDHIYEPLIARTMDELKQVILDRGWPSDKLIGIYQRNIMEELNIDAPELEDYYALYKQVYPDNVFSWSQFVITEKYLGATLFYPVMAHYASHYTNVYFPDEVYMQEIAKGNLHPKDFGYLMDHLYSNYPREPRKPDVSKGQYYFGVSRYFYPDSIAVSKPFPIPLNEVNRLREKFYMPPFEQDRAKLSFAKEHGMNLGWGYSGTR